MLARHHLDLWPGFKRWGIFPGVAVPRYSSEGVGWECQTRARCSICCCCCLQIPWPTQSFCIQWDSENFGQTIKALGAREQEEVRTWPKVFHLLLSARMREKLCFVIFLSAYLDAVHIFFLSGSFSFSGDHQLWSVNKINPKHWETRGGSVCSCTLHVWNSWLCNLGKWYVASKKQSKSNHAAVFAVDTTSEHIQLK